MGSFMFGSEAINVLVNDDNWQSIGEKLRSMYVCTSDFSNHDILQYLEGVEDGAYLHPTPLHIAEALDALKKYLQGSFIYN